MYSHWVMIRCYLNIEAGNPNLMLYLFLGYKLEFLKQETHLTSTYIIFASVCEESTHHFWGCLVKFNGVFLFSWVTTVLVTFELICDVISCWDYCEYHSVTIGSVLWLAVSDSGLLAKLARFLEISLCLCLL